MMPEMVNRLGPWTITFEQEMLPPVTVSAPAKDWRFIDAAGHGHFWQDGYPTLKIESEECFGCDYDDDEPHLIDYWVCPHCGERVSPATTMRESAVRGRLRATLEETHSRGRKVYDGFTEDEARALMRDPVDAIPRLTADRQPTSQEWR